jgi:type IV pilus assembly protein PilX
VALVVALILLVVISLVGLAAIGGSTLENKIAASQYDRQLAFQNAEAALRVAQAQIAAHPHGYARKCRASGVVCPANPFKDADLGKGKIVTVNPDRFQAGARAAGQPQYVIEDMGQWPNWKVGLGCENKLRERNAPPCPWVDYYRITARSGDPAKVGERAIVTLQAIVKQG